MAGEDPLGYSVGVNNQPPPGQDPGMWARIMAYLNPPNAQIGPGHGDGPPPPPPANPAMINSTQGPGGTPVNAGLINAAITGAPAAVQGGGGSSGGGGASGPWPSQDPRDYDRTVNRMLPNSPPMGPPPPPSIPFDPTNPASHAMPFPGQVDPSGVFAPRTPSALPGGAAVGGAAVHPAVAAAAAARRNPFTVIDRPNMGPAPMYDQQGNPIGPAMTGGPLARGGPPKMTALDLSGLFGGGQQPPAAAAAPAKIRTAPGAKKVYAPAVPPPRPKDASVARARILAPDLYGQG